MKKRLATAWLCGCSGCHMSLLDLGPALLELLGRVELVSCPPLVDAKHCPDADLVLVEGGVSTDADREELLALRQRAGTLVALGTCACFGGIPGLRNLHPAASVLRRSFVEAEGTESAGMPAWQDVPLLEPAVKPLAAVVPVDAYVPGCPPPTALLGRALADLLEGRVPQLGGRNLCDECPRKHRVMLTNAYEFVAENVSAVFELDEVDPVRCFVEQGVPCLGPATREGCGGACMRANMPCRGCMGPTPRAVEQGSKWLDAVASVLPAGALSLLDDPVGLGYGFALPASVWPSVRQGDADE